MTEQARKKSSHSVRLVIPRPEPVFGAAELRAVENLLDALEARGIVFARPHGGEGGLERVDLSRAALVGLALGTGAKKTRERTSKPKLADGETLLGESERFFYVGHPSGWVESRGRAEHGTNSTVFGGRDYWRHAQTIPSFTRDLRLTDAGKTW